MSTRDTGFPEPLSTERNTTLPFNKTQAQVVPVGQSALGGDKQQQQKAEAAKEEMYSGIQEKDQEEVDGKAGKVKKVLGKLGCAS